jgi:hypothetical protein
MPLYNIYKQTKQLKMNNALTKFVAELALRFFSKKPKFFVIIQVLSVVTGAVAALISYLESSSVELPVWVASVGNVNVIIASIVALIVAQFTNSDPEVTEKIQSLD